jgi:hypothetical protein
VSDVGVEFLLDGAPDHRLERGLKVSFGHLQHDHDGDGYTHGKRTAHELEPSRYAAIPSTSAVELPELAGNHEYRAADEQKNRSRFRGPAAS